MASPALVPLLKSGQAVDWWFAFKFNDARYPGDPSSEPGTGIFGGTPSKYKEGFSLSYAVASSANPVLTLGAGSIGSSLNDPLGATFDQVYHGSCNDVLWNDQFSGDPVKNEEAPWGHSKGALAWDVDGNGFVLQVSTPSWPGSGSAKSIRKTDGNTLGCIKDDDVLVSQHFFALKLTKADVAEVLTALDHASVVTSVSNLQVFSVSAGPADLAKLAQALGKKEPSTETSVTTVRLSSGVGLISKPSGAHVPPWQLVSSSLGGIPLRAASWWCHPEIPSTQSDTPIACWLSSLAKPGAVDIAQAGSWMGKPIGLLGEAKIDGNHAKIGVSMGGPHPLSIFGDLNQQGTLDGKEDAKGCASSQNGRGGTFYVLENQALHDSLLALLTPAN